MPAAQTIEDLEPNAQLGQYTILEHVADGGMGHVYRAFEPSLNREVAIKVLKPELASNTSQVESFEEEAQNIAALSHPNIVPIYYLGRQGELFYFVMAFVSGGATLDNWIDANTPLTPEHAQWVLGQAIEALDTAWQHRIIHLDIKPSNFLVDSRGQVLLTDFGLARSLANTQGQNTVRESFGTPAYMSPEQILKKPTSLTSDIYSLGATMYHLMTMHFLFDGDSIEDIVVAHVKKPFPFKEAQSYGLPPGWINLIDKMTQKKPEDRFSDYDELREALNNVDRLQSLTASTRSENEEGPEAPSVLPVPNRSGASRETLYGLLSANCATWASTSVDSALKVKKTDVLNSVLKSREPLTVASFTEAALELQEDESSEISDIVESLSMMPEVEDYIIALANTGFYSTPEENLNDSRTAAERVGTKKCHQLIVTGLILRDDFPSSREFDWMPLIQHGISTGILATLILEYIDRNPDGSSSISKATTQFLSAMSRTKALKLAYFAGLMHDVGLLPMGEVSPYPVFSSLRLSMDNQTPLRGQLRSMLGIDHHELGEKWAEKFSFQGVVKEAIAHYASNTRRHSRLTASVFLADQITQMNGLGYSGNPIVEHPDLYATPAWQFLQKDALREGITPEMFEEEIIKPAAELPVFSRPRNS